MVTKTYICDICKTSVGEHELYPIEMSVSRPKKENLYVYKLSSCKRDICEVCLLKKGVLVVIPEDSSQSDFEIKNVKTLEAKLINFLTDLGVVFEQ